MKNTSSIIYPVKRLSVEQDRFLKKEQRVRNCKFQQNCRLQGSILKLRVTNNKLNLELLFSQKIFASNFEIASC